ncbi:PLP-dependent transferase [Pilatotrama ljubarskyi]|nr:PLP-dependent transferase [Pilatotrama ljubarskyi]
MSRSLAPLDTPLSTCLSEALETRRKRQLCSFDLANTTSSTASPDVHSNDFLSLTNDPDLRQLFLDKLSRSQRVLGVAGSRRLGGNAAEHIEFETRMATFFDSPSALLFNSGYDANVAFWQAVPQEGDVIVLDELVHASSRDGMLLSRASKSLYAFSHNSPMSFQETVLRVLEDHPLILQGKSTLFVAVEAAYSMDGDFAPLPDIVRILETYVPRESTHILVDEAHSTGVFGPQGKGIVHLLGLQDRIHTVLHTFGKARALTGAVLLTSPLVRYYIINYGRPFIFTTAMPISMICGLHASFDYLEGPVGDYRRETLRRLCEHFRGALKKAFKHIPPSLLSLRESPLPSGYPSTVLSPITPVLTSHPAQLAAYLNQFGYAVEGVFQPVVPKGEERIRISLHALNTKAELEDLVARLTQWAAEAQTTGSQTQSVGQIRSRL